MTIHEVEKHSKPHWNDRRPDGWEFLAAVQNPWTDLWYDIYWVNNESFTCQHGNEPHEYGSMRLDFVQPGHLTEEQLPQEDYLFGLAVAMQLCHERAQR